MRLYLAKSQAEAETLIREKEQFMGRLEQETGPQPFTKKTDDKELPEVVEVETISSYRESEYSHRVNAEVDEENKVESEQNFAIRDMMMTDTDTNLGRSYVP